ncbi:hypothetical protein C5E10_18050 [Pseudoclavibacter sp. RFBG4]|nr:hypothetical protein C5E10_18050 [Pseudoclavibacter sp. RFBG4]
MKIEIHNDAVAALRTSPEAIGELKSIGKEIGKRMQANVNAKMGQATSDDKTDDGSGDDIVVDVSRKARRRGRLNIKTNSLRARIAVARDPTVATRAIAGPYKPGA